MTNVKPSSASNFRSRQGDYHDTTQYAFAHRHDWAKLPWHRPKPICLVVSLTLWNFQSGSKKMDVVGFHAAFDFGAHGRAIINHGATMMLYSMYPSRVQRWINQRGGLTSHMIYLRGKELMSMYHPCYLDAQALATGASK
jgi:hypothetical protein